MIAMILTILVSMLVYIFWFMKSEFQRVLDRIDQSTLGVARMQRELSQSTVQQFHDQLQESFGKLDEGEEEEEEGDEEEEDEEEQDEAEDEEEDGDGEDGVVDVVDVVPEEDEATEDPIGERPPSPELEVLKTSIEQEIETAIEELDTIGADPPKKRGRKSKK